MQQGQYDGLCGVYSIVNSVSALAKNSKTDGNLRKALFDVVCRQLDDDGLLLSAVTGGISAGDYDGFIGRALKAIEHEMEIGVDSTTPFRSGPLTAAAFYKELADRIGEGTRSLAIVWVSGEWDHWTVVRSISEARINLIDSDGRDHLARSFCSIYPDASGKYILHPRQTYLLTIRPTKAEPTR